MINPILQSGMGALLMASSTGGAIASVPVREDRLQTNMVGDTHRRRFSCASPQTRLCDALGESTAAQNQTGTSRRLSMSA
jgi:hypothetical protein